MSGQRYSREQIQFILDKAVLELNVADIIRAYNDRFNVTLTSSQVKYVKTKYGKDAAYK